MIQFIQNRKLLVSEFMWTMYYNTQKDKGFEGLGYKALNLTCLSRDSIFIDPRADNG